MARISGTHAYARPTIAAVILTACLALGMILGPTSAGASNGNPVILGVTNTEEGSTKIQTSNCCDPAFIVSGQAAIAIDAQSNANEAMTATTTSSNFAMPAIRAYHSDGVAVQGMGAWGVAGLGGTVGVRGATDQVGGYGVYGSAYDGYGVYGIAFDSGNGVYGTTADATAAGVWGVNSGNGAGVEGENQADGNGVIGTANNAFASGVYGQNNGNGYGVAGRSNTGVGLFGDSLNGTAIEANSPNGVALNVQGVVVTNRAGVATITAGTKSVTVSVANVKSTSLVLATVQSARNLKVWVLRASVTPGKHGSVTIYLNASTADNVQVAWFVLN